MHCEIPPIDLDCPAQGQESGRVVAVRESTPLLSVVIPVHNEAGNIAGLLDEVAAALDGRDDFEVIVVDDLSQDATREVLDALRPRWRWLRVMHHQRNAGQSAALISGARAARGRWVGTLDGDGQNDPADLPRMLAELARRDDPELKLLQGWRQQRQDTGFKRLSSKLANLVRGALLADHARDSGCGIRMIERSLLIGLPHFDHMHRFIPALVAQSGWKLDNFAVNHRARAAGQSHYGLWDRLWVGIVDLIGVAWLGRRARPVRCIEAHRGAAK